MTNNRIFEEDKSPAVSDRFVTMEEVDQVIYDEQGINPEFQRREEEAL